MLTTTVGVNQSGAMIGGQIGCDYQFPSNLVLGIEAAVSGSTMKGSRPNCRFSMTLIYRKSSDADFALFLSTTCAKRNARQREE